VRRLLVVRIDGDRLVMLARRRGRGLALEGPDHRIETIPIEVLRRALVEPAAQPIVAESERLVAGPRSGPPGGRVSYGRSLPSGCARNGSGRDG
jgi:hypothetical protein